MCENFNVHKYDISVRKLIEHNQNELLQCIPDDYSIGSILIAHDWEYIIRMNPSDIKHIANLLSQYTKQNDFEKWIEQYKKWKVKRNLEWIESQRRPITS